MTPRCDSIQERMAAECAAPRPWSSSIEEHLRQCEACARKAGELERLSGVLGQLPSVPAPAELEGRVVAVCQAGFRQDRAVRGLQEVGALKAPSALDERIELVFAEMRASGELPRPQAPSELDERVSADLADPTRSNTQRFLSRLRRLPAPSSLLGRVDRELRHGTESAPGRPWRAPAWAAGLAAAAGLLLWLGFSPASSPEVPDLPSFAFEVVEVSGLEALSPRGRAIGSRLLPNLSPLVPAEPEAGVEERAASATSSQGAAPGAPLDRTSRKAANQGGTGSGAHRISGGQASRPGGSTTSSGSLGSAGLGPLYLMQSGDAPSRHSFHAQRRVLHRSVVDGFVHEVDYREEIATDGEGRFTIVPRDLEAPILDFPEQDAFLSSQKDRESFFFRHRGFAVRDARAFSRNYQVAQVGAPEVYAGRECERFLVSRKDGSGGTVELRVDPRTALILWEEHRDEQGELVFSQWCETFELDPDLSAFELTGGPSAWVPFDPATTPEGFEGKVLIPSAPPTGFELQEAGVQTAGGPSPSGWAQLVYGDGLEEVFFVCEDESGSGGSGGTVLRGGQPSGSGGDIPQLGTVEVCSVGPWSVVEGQVGGRYVLVVGRLHQEELLLMVQSAVE